MRYNFAIVCKLSFEINPIKVHFVLNWPYYNHIRSVYYDNIRTLDYWQIPFKRIRKENETHCKLLFLMHSFWNTSILIFGLIKKRHVLQIIWSVQLQTLYFVNPSLIIVAYESNRFINFHFCSPGLTRIGYHQRLLWNGMSNPRKDNPNPRIFKSMGFWTHIPGIFGIAFFMRFTNLFRWCLTGCRIWHRIK